MGDGLSITFVPMSKVAPPIACEIARAEAEDAAEILDLQKLAYRSEAQLYDDWTLPPLTQTLESYARRDFARGGAQGGARRADRRLRARARERRRLPVGRLVVRPQLQGRGIGTQLMEQIEREFPQTRRLSCFTGARSAGNIRLYERLGYVRAREKVLSPAITLVFMEKTAMTLRITRLGTPRAANEGTRLGTVRRPPRAYPRPNSRRQTGTTSGTPCSRETPSS